MIRSALLKPVFCVLASLLISTCLLADLPSLRLDGSWGKGEAYEDPYQYSEQDFAAAAKNPYKVGIKERIKKGDNEYATIEAKLKSLPKWDQLGQELSDKYVKQVRTEFDLTEKEQQTVKAYSHQFSDEAKTGKRVYVSKVMKLGEKEYRVNGCRFFGRGDWNGDGVPEVFLRYDDGATHAGARSKIKVFSENGDLVFYMDLMTLYMGAQRVYDYNGDGKVDLVIMPDGKAKEYLVLSCPDEGEELEPFVSEISKSRHLAKPSRSF